MRIGLYGLSLLACLLLGVESAQAFVNVEVDLSTQRMSVASGTGAHFLWPVSTGRPGYRTPAGVFRPQRMMAMTYSIEYENAPMPHAIFFTGGYAIHGTYEVGHLGWPASHGCVRLAPGNAATLFYLVQHEGARISIYGTAPGGGGWVSRRPSLWHRHLAVPSVWHRHFAVALPQSNEYVLPRASLQEPTGF